MASAGADPAGGHTGPAPWTAGGARQNRETDSEAKSQPPERPAAKIHMAGDQSPALMFDDNT